MLVTRAVLCESNDLTVSLFFSAVNVCGQFWKTKNIQIRNQRSAAPSPGAALECLHSHGCQSQNTWTGLNQLHEITCTFECGFNVHTPTVYCIYIYARNIHVCVFVCVLYIYICVWYTYIMYICVGAYVCPNPWQSLGHSVMTLMVWICWLRTRNATINCDWCIWATWHRMRR